MMTESVSTDLRDALTRAPDLAWAHRNLALLGWGESARFDPGTGADRFEHALRDLRSTSSPLALAAFTFDENVSGSVVLVPNVLMRIDGGGARFLIGSRSDLPDARPNDELPRGRIGADDPDGWRKSALQALAAIRAKEIEKIVLSRKVTVEFNDSIQAHRVLANLVAGQPDSHTFLVDRLVGSSPELLISLDARRVRSISLAGSADLDDPSAMSSFDTAKMVREHMLAADSVEESLAPFCSQLERSPRRVATYGDIQHMSTSFDGSAHPGTLITELLAALHPTAAVAGTPTKPALELIREIEKHERARYAGPVGWFDRSGDGEFAIALRCGLIEGNRTTLYTGAGLVEGSDPDLEFEETQIKLRPMLRATGLS